MGPDNYGSVKRKKRKLKNIYTGDLQGILGLILELKCNIQYNPRTLRIQIFLIEHLV